MKPILLSALCLALLTLFGGCAKSPPTAEDTAKPATPSEELVTPDAKPVVPEATVPAEEVPPVTIAPAERQELDDLAATALKRGGTPPVIFDYAHGVTQAGDTAALRRQVESAQAGDVVTIPVGVYRDIGVLHLRAAGTAEAPITLRAAEPGRAVFTGASAVEVSGDFWIVEGLLFDRAVFRGNNYTSIISVRGAKGVRVTECAFLSCGLPDVKYVPILRWQDGAPGGRLDHCTFVDSLSMTVQVRVGPTEDDTARGMRIDHNHFRDIRRRHKNGGECIQIGSNPMKYSRMRADAVVEFNRFERADGDGEVISNKSSGNLIRSNTFIGCGGALWLRGGEACEVTGNLWRGGSAGIVAYGRDHTIRGNVIEGTHSYALIAEYGSEWESVKDAGLSFEALQDSRIEGNAIISPVVRGLVYGAFRMDPKKAASRTVAPHGNVFRSNVFTGQRGTLLIVEQFGATRFENNQVHLGGSAKLGNELDGFRMVSAEAAIAAMPRVEEVEIPNVGASWLF